MNFPTGAQIMMSVLYAVIFGVFGGVLKSAIKVVIQYFETIATLPRSIIRTTENKYALKRLFKEGISTEYSNTAIKEFISDFIFTMLYGILLCLLMYIAADGAFRLYISVISLGATYASSKTLGRFLEKFFLLILKVICRIFLSISAALVYPLRMLLEFIVKQFKVKRA